MSSLTNLPNIDNNFASKLEQVGIKTEKELKILGAEKAFLLYKEVDPKAKIEHLFALEAAIEGIPVEQLSRAKIEELRMFFELCE